MSGKIVASHSWSLSPMPETFRFSPRPNQAHQINWRPWGKMAFQEAIYLDKPVFLVISSLWCQWSHLMDEITLSEPSIISIVNNNYIPVRVDSDLRPDVNTRYNQNGWPSVVLLSAEAEILWGGVYVPPKQMLYYLGHIRRYYREHRQELTEQAGLLQAQRLQHASLHNDRYASARSLLPRERVALENLPNRARQVLCDLYDADNGGFILHPHLKFPHAEALELLLTLARSLQEPKLLEMVCYSLEQMREGGLWDKEDGGFFRYSAASDWSMPHTEKMLEENAAMLHLILLVARTTQVQKWHDLAKRLIIYINNALWQPTIGAFSGSQCADEEYYEPGPYSRASQKAPPIDKTIYTSWNARMISSYLLASQVLPYSSFSTMALQALDYLCQHAIHHDGSTYHYVIDGHAELPGQLADQVWLTRALLDAYEFCGRKRYLEMAIVLMHFTVQELLDKQSNLFYDMVEDPDAVGHIASREQPLTENAIATECLIRMSVSSKRQNMHDTALLVLAACQEKYCNIGVQSALYASVIAQAIECKWL